MFYFALLGFDVEFIFTEKVEDLLGDYPVFFDSLGVDDNVIDVDGDVSFCDEVSEYVIHHCLERGGGVGESEEHYCGFVQAMVSSKRRLPFISFFHSDVIVSPSDVEFCENL